MCSHDRTQIDPPYIFSLSRLGAYLSLGVFLTYGFISAAGQSDRPLNRDLVASTWPAYWIASSQVPAACPGVFYFRRDLLLSSVPQHFWVHISADNRFILHVNGKYAAEGPARSDLFHWRFETVDLAPFLQPGQNVLAAVVWNFGELAPVAQMTNRTGFLMQGDTNAEAAVNTGLEWVVRQEPGRAALGHNGANGYYAAGPAEKIDGRLLDWDWDQKETASSGWEKPELVGRAATRESEDAPTSWELVQDPLPPMEHSLANAGDPVRVDGMQSLPAFPAAPVIIPANTRVKLLLDNRVLQTAYPELIVSGGRDAEIDLTYSEALYDAQGAKGNRNEVANRHMEGITDQFVADGGDARAFTPLWWRTWRYLQIEVVTKGQPLRLDALNARFTAYPFDAKATIAGDIPQLDRLWQTSWRTARLCAHETYMDAPYWEQLQYVGDTRIQALISYVMTGDPRLARQAITSIDDSHVPEGITQSRYPSELPQFIPTFSLLWINMIHDYWMYVDDLPLVRETLPHTRTVLDWYSARLRPDGLLGKMPWWEFGDWIDSYRNGDPPQEANGGSTFLCLQFVEALQAAEELESLYGSQERAREYRALIVKISNAVNRENWDSVHGLYADTPAKNSWSQEANILAVIDDVAPRSQQQEILRRLLASTPNGSVTLDGKTVPPMDEPTYYFRFYLSRALEHAGMGDLYLSHLDPWRKMLGLGLSTWAEKPEPTRSDCHAWSASPNYDLLTIVAGIHPDAPGFRKVLISPHLSGLRHLDVSMPLPQGLIRTQYEWGGNRWNATLTLPPGLNGELSWKNRTWTLHPGKQSMTLP